MEISSDSDDSESAVALALSTSGKSLPQTRPEPQEESLPEAHPNAQPVAQATGDDVEMKEDVSVNAKEATLVERREEEEEEGEEDPYDDLTDDEDGKMDVLDAIGNIFFESEDSQGGDEEQRFCHYCKCVKFKLISKDHNTE